MKPHRASDRPAIAVGLPLSTGFPSPADDYEEPPLDLHHLVVENPYSTFFMRAETKSMGMARIEPGDILVVDRSKEPRDDMIIIAVVQGMFRVMRYRSGTDGFVLEDDNGLVASPGAQIWGVVTYIVHRAAA